MGRPKLSLPSYLLHKATGQARTTIDGRDFYLGKFGSDDSRRRYGELVARFASGLPLLDPLAQPSADVTDDPGPSVNELCIVFWRHAEKHYVKPGTAGDGEESKGTPTSEISCFRSCLKILRELYGFTPAKDFGPLAMKAVRTKMIELKWARTNINRMIGRIRLVFKHGIENEMIGPDVLAKLQAVAPLLSGRSEAHDNPARSAVDESNIQAVKAEVRPMVRDLIDLQVLTGARSGELLMLTTNMLDRSGEVWIAEILEHKTLHHGQKRFLHFGPQAKLILSKYLSANRDGRLFSMTRAGYCRAITRACEKQKIDRWTPHWLRHTFCTRVREQFGTEAAQSMAGHSSSDMTVAYARKMNKLATQTAAAVG